MEDIAPIRIISWADEVEREEAVAAGGFSKAHAVDAGGFSKALAVDAVACPALAVDAALAENLGGHAALAENASPPVQPPASQPEFGAPIGIRAIQSILMSATQTSLSHFHTAGMKDDNYGKQVRPSIADIFNSVYKSNNTSMTFTTDLDIRQVRKTLVYTILDDLVLKVRTNFTGLPDRENIWYEVLGKNMSDKNILRFYIDFTKMKKFDLTLEEIGNICFDDFQWVTSPDFMGIIDVEFIDNYVSSILSRMKRKVCGIKDITMCEYKSFVNICTTGSNILAVSKILSYEHNKNLISNNIADVETRFGIEAANYMLNELIGSRIVSDFMTRTGKTIPFSKNSIEVFQKGLFTSMGFERPKDDIKRFVVAGSSKDQARSPAGVYNSIIIGEDPDTCFKIIGRH